MTAPNARDAPLAGVTVLDFSQVVSGPICGRVLADLGADVVKLEPFEGDVIRQLEPKVGDDAMSVYFTWANAGKRSIAVNLRDPRGTELVDPSRDGERRRPRELPARRPRASSASTRRRCSPATRHSSTARSTDGAPPTRGRTGAAYAAMVQAEVGRVELDARLRDAPMEQSPHVDGDITPGLLAVSGIVAALFRRERTGAGDHVDVSMAEVLLYTDEWTTTELTGYRRSSGSRTPGSTRSSRWPTAPASPSWVTRTPRVTEVAAALTDEPVPAAATRTREESLALLGEPDRPRARLPDGRGQAGHVRASWSRRCGRSARSPPRRGRPSARCSRRSSPAPASRRGPSGPATAPSARAAARRGSASTRREVLARTPRSRRRVARRVGGRRHHHSHTVCRPWERRA